jgi:hypothetical protein
MKNSITYLALAAVLLFAAGPQVPVCHAMGSRNGAPQQPDEKSRTEDQKDKKPGDAVSPKDTESPEKKKAPPQKKPRLKYRDQFECSC